MLISKKCHENPKRKSLVSAEITLPVISMHKARNSFSSASLTKNSHVEIQKKIEKRYTKESMFMLESMIGALRV